jgi:murein DD-endopeptidase MepM/ murein hydrolase activator NlpD
MDLSKYNSKAGKKVKRGDIGYVGSTGDLKASFTLWYTKTVK